jgi:hypothetical protein
VRARPSEKRQKPSSFIIFRVLALVMHLQRRAASA